MNKKTITRALIGVSAFFALAQTAYGATSSNCQPIYGGSGACEQNSPVTINKQVINPQTNAYVENLTINDPQYEPGETILYKLTITNPTITSIKNIEVYEFLPQYIEYVKGQGTYDQTKKILSFSLSELKSKETKTYVIETKAAVKEKLPDDPQARCVLNKVSVTASNKTSEDNTLVCIAKDTASVPKNMPIPTTIAAPIATKAQPTPTAKPTPAANQQQPQRTSKGGLPIYEPQQTTDTPSTGPEAAALPSLLSLFSIGLFLKSKAKT